MIANATNVEILADKLTTITVYYTASATIKKYHYINESIKKLKKI